MEHHALPSAQQLPALSKLGPSWVCAPSGHKGLLGSHLQGDLPGPGTRDRLLTIHNPGIATDDWLNGRGAAAWRESKGVHRSIDL